MSDEGGGLASVESDGFTVTSNTESAEEMTKTLKEADKDEGEKPEKPKKPSVTEAASELGKRGGKASAQARAEKEEEPEPKEKRGNPRHDVQARIQELAQERAEERRQRQELEQRLARIEAERRPAQQEARDQHAAQQQPQNGRPTPDQYATYEEYVEAFSDWKLESYKAQERAERQQQEQYRIANQGHEARKQGFVERFQAARESDPDIDSKIDPVLAEQLQPTPPGMPPTAASTIADEVLDSPDAARLLAHFTAHPEDVRKLVVMSSSREIARAIAKIEDRLDGEPTKREQPSVSKAKPPVKPVTTSAQVGEEDVDDIEDFDTYVKKANARDNRARRGR